MRAWEEFLAKQEKELGKETLDKWLRPLKMIRFDACNLYLEASDSFKALWFEEHMRTRVLKGLYNNNHKSIKVHISVASQNKESGSTKIKTTPLSSQPMPPLLRFDELDPSFSFETFVISPSHLLAYKLLAEAAPSKQETASTVQFNPIYLHGRSGTGKTHLMMATAARLKQMGKKTLYVRGETFTEHVVDAIRTAEIQQFRRIYRSVDALLIDDVEVFSRKAATQEELFHTFNTLHLDGKQIILSAGLPPNDLKFIEPRLISRFEWGIVVPLAPPTKEQMHSILLQRAERMNFPLEESVITFLFETFKANSKALIRALDALILRTHLNRGLNNATTLTPSLKTTQHILKDLILEEERALLTPGKIIQTVAEYYGIRIDDILSKSQARECVLPRQIAMHLCRQNLNLPYMKIGDIFSRDHSTVMASIKQVQRGVETKNHEIFSPLNSILKLLER